MNTRIKEIRESEKLTQEEFGKRIGSARNTIANYETGNRKPSNAVINSICREFNVNEEWLRTGQGEMFNFVNDEVAEIVSDILEEDNPFFDLILEIMKTYRHLDDNSKSIIHKMCSDLFNNIKNSDINL